MNSKKILDWLHKKEIDSHKIDSVISRLPKWKIKDLIFKLIDNEDKESTLFSFQDFIKWEQEPKLTYLQWLKDIFLQKWRISQNDFTELSEKEVEEQYEDLKSICLSKIKFRQKHQEIKEINISIWEIKKATTLKTILQEHWINEIWLLVRSIQNVERIDKLREIWNDRDNSSLRINNHHNGGDWEELAMIRTWILSWQTIYASKIDSERHDYRFLEQNRNLAIYYPDALVWIWPSWYQKNNWFLGFLFWEEIMARSIAAIIKVNK